MDEKDEREQLSAVVKSAVEGLRELRQQFEALTPEKQEALEKLLKDGRRAEIFLKEMEGPIRDGEISVTDARNFVLLIAPPRGGTQ